MELAFMDLARGWTATFSSVHLITSGRGWKSRGVFGTGRAAGTAVERKDRGGM